jgi:hypothetical protein
MVAVAAGYGRHKTRTSFVSASRSAKLDSMRAATEAT